MLRIAMQCSTTRLLWKAFALIQSVELKTPGEDSIAINILWFPITPFFVSPLGLGQIALCIEEIKKL